MVTLGRRGRSDRSVGGPVSSPPRSRRPARSMPVRRLGPSPAPPRTRAGGPPDFGRTARGTADTPCGGAQAV